MSWGITIKNVILSRVGKSEVATELKEAEIYKRQLEHQIIMGIANPQEEDMSITSLLDEYCETVTRHFLLNIANEYPEDTEEY